MALINCLKKWNVLKTICNHEAVQMISINIILRVLASFCSYTQNYWIGKATHWTLYRSGTVKTAISISLTIWRRKKTTTQNQNLRKFHNFFSAAARASAVEICPEKSHQKIFARLYRISGCQRLEIISFTFNQFRDDISKICHWKNFGK